MVQRITAFVDDHRFLSNFYPSVVVVGDGRAYATVEHAYQAVKTFDDKQREEIYKAKTPGQAKRLGQKVTLRGDWTDELKLSYMRYLVEQKFDVDLELREKLLTTGDAHIEEGNTWNDTFWGTCKGEGQNHLGKIIMDIRKKISK